MDALQVTFSHRPPRDFSTKAIDQSRLARINYKSRSPSINSLNYSQKSENTEKSKSQRRKRYHSQTTTPMVTASSWCIMDELTSKTLHGHNDLNPREVASLTKIMTCILCLNLSKMFELEISTETIIVSNRACSVTGTSAELMPGDQITIKDLLFGLMLPSGNDAAIALAEFFGTILSQSSGKPVRRFIMEMNKSAKEIGMPHTHFANPHGLMHKKNLATARDIARLACYAMKDKDFRDIVNSKSYLAEVKGKDGFLRFLHWKNTNKLLGKGFDGVKTGVTLTAGPCLCVSSHKEISLVIVLLNSKTMEDRWIDAKKIFNWAVNKFI